MRPLLKLLRPLHSAPRGVFSHEHARRLRVFFSVLSAIAYLRTKTPYSHRRQGRSAPGLHIPRSGMTRRYSFIRESRIPSTLSDGPDTVPSQREGMAENIWEWGGGGDKIVVQ